MLGYASGRADLARGAEVDVLDTGDLGYLRDGYLYLTGRAKRIVKVLGVRTSLDDLERTVERPGHPPQCSATATTCCTWSARATRRARAAAPAAGRGAGVSARHVVFRQVVSLPRTAGGKVDYRHLARAVDANADTDKNTATTPDTDTTAEGGSQDEAGELADPVRPGT